MKKLQLAAVFCLLLTGKTISAQTTIFNTPSTDVAAVKSVYFETNFVGRPGSFASGGFQTFGVRGVYGLKRTLEVGANLSYTRNGSTSPVELQPNLKWKAYENEKHRVAVSGGAIVFVPLNRAAGTRPTAMVYGNLSKEIPAIKGFRLTFGGYGLIGTKQADGTRAGVMLAFEKTLVKRVTLVGDWFSGKNRVGLAAAGINFSLPKRQVIFAGYNFANTGRRNDAFAAYYGISF